jgi:hypothetical protein
MSNDLSKWNSVTDPKGANSRMPAKENINSAFLLLHHLVQSIKIYQIRYVILNTGDIFADPPYCCINFALASTEDESIGTLLDKSLRRSKDLL